MRNSIYKYINFADFNGMENAKSEIIVYSQTRVGFMNEHREYR